MQLSPTIIVATLLTEIIYYSLFLKSCRKEGKLSRYLIIGILVTVLAFIVGTNDLLSYLLLVLIFLLGLKYIVKIRTSLYDMFIIIIMLFAKVALELVPFILFYTCFRMYTLYVACMIFLKILFLIYAKDKLHNFYKRLKRMRDDNVFKIRYIFICCTYIYVIFTALFKIYLN